MLFRALAVCCTFTLSATGGGWYGGVSEEPLGVLSRLHPPCTHQHLHLLHYPAASFLYHLLLHLYTKKGSSAAAPLQSSGSLDIHLHFCIDLS